jgi:hypothetical protein
MEPYQWFLMGMMVAWTPGLVALALLLSLSDSKHKNLENSEH